MLDHFVPRDSGPIYVETLNAFHPWLVEPLNTLSNLAFLAILFYWLPKARGPSNMAKYLRVALPVLFIGWLGGTLYHAWRSSEAWHILDYFPILFSAGWTASWFWEAHRRRYLKYSATVVPFAAGGLFFMKPVSNYLTTPTYFALGLSVAVPVALYAINDYRKAFWPGFLSSACFGLALLSRQFEFSLVDYIPVGTHFLWHLLGAASTHFLMVYLNYVLDRVEASA